MKTFVRLALLLLAVIAVCQTGIVLAEDYYWVSSDKDTPVAGDQKVAAPAQPSGAGESCYSCNACDSCCCSAVDCGRTWYVDFKIQEMWGYTSYQFGTDGPWHGGSEFAPLSKLDFSLDSTWTGLRVGVERCNWDVHLEWLMPMVQHIDGVMSDYDWNINSPYNDPTRLDSLTHSSQRWNDGQKLELEADYKYSDCFLGMPVEVWPLAGFRWQRFDITAYNIDYIVPDRGHTYDGDVITFNQQYYIGYIGFQLRREIERACKPPVNLVFQFDWGGAGGYNVDHHLLREGDRYTMESTGGDAVHVGLTGSIPLNCHLSLGLQADYTRIRTTGTHRLLNEPYGQDESWSNGVLVKSEQTAVSAYLQYLW
jgi:hypothetical protein